MVTGRLTLHSAARTALASRLSWTLPQSLQRTANLAPGAARGGCNSHSIPAMEKEAAEGVARLEMG